MKQTKLNEIWDLINMQINNSKIKRVNWKLLLGKTLTQFITELKEKGFTKEETYNFIIDRLDNNYFYNIELQRRIKISVYARYGEQLSFKKREVK